MTDFFNFDSLTDWDESILDLTVACMPSIASPISERAGDCGSHAATLSSSQRLLSRYFSRLKQLRLQSKNSGTI
jgi:hypothetical protein